MISKEIDSISSYIKIIREFQSNSSSGQIFYRGQKNGYKQNWKLIPSFYREKRSHPNIPFYNDINEEINSIYKFVEKNIDYFTNIDFDDLISIINILQHYGFPTRVLDVTSDPLISLYFSLENCKKEDNPVIYLIRSEKCKASYFVNQELKHYYQNDKRNNENKVVMVNGSILSDRIKNQKGDFILFFEDIDIREMSDFVIEEVTIDKKSVNKINKELDLLGINKSTVYPSLEEESKKFISALNKANETLEKISDNFNNSVGTVNKFLKDYSIDQEDILPIERRYLKAKGALHSIDTKKAKKLSSNL